MKIYYIEARVTLDWDADPDTVSQSLKMWAATEDAAIEFAYAMAITLWKESVGTQRHSQDNEIMNHGSLLPWDNVFRIVHDITPEHEFFEMTDQFKTPYHLIKRVEFDITDQPTESTDTVVIKVFRPKQTLLIEEPFQPSQRRQIEI